MKRSSIWTSLGIASVMAWATSANAAPPIVTPPQSVQVSLGGTASFTVSAVGATPFTYHWYHWDQNGGAAAIDRCNTSATCTIEPVTQADAGEYNVEVYDANGEHAHGDPRARLTIVTGDEIVAASCSRADVQAAIDQIPAGGSGTARIPPGSCDWVDGLVVIDDKASIHIAGSGRDQTTIWRSAADDGNTVLSDEDPAAIFTFDCRNGQRVEFSGIHLVGPNGPGNNVKTSVIARGLELRWDCHDFMIHDNRISKFSYAGILIKGPDARGVIYDNEFLDNWKNGLGYGVAVTGWHGSVHGLYWPAFEPGSANAVFIEDNLFSGSRHNVASNTGSRYVFRHNELVAWRTNSERDPLLLQTFWDGQVDAHGVDPDAGVAWDEQQSTGSRSWEVYDNLFTLADDDFIPQGENSPSNVTSSSMRGGNGMVFCNRYSRGAHTGPSIFGEPSVRFESNENCHLWVDSHPAPFQVGFQGLSFFWDNSGDVTNDGRASRGTYMDDGTCVDLIVEGVDYFNMSPAQHGGSYADYQPYPYPHPLRNEVIFRDSFDSIDGAAFVCDARRHATPTP